MLKMFPNRFEKLLNVPQRVRPGSKNSSMYPRGYAWVFFRLRLFCLGKQRVLARLGWVDQDDHFEHPERLVEV